MDKWLEAPAFIINMDACPERLTITKTRVTGAGYTDVRRVAAIDARTCDLTSEWARLRDPLSPPVFASHANDFRMYPGTQCCFLSWIKTLDLIIAENIPIATVFEDDVMFHKDWAQLAPAFYENTPTDFHMCYIGGQLDRDPCHVAEISCTPTFCTHAIMFTLQGAKTMREYLVNSPRGVYTIDCMLKEAEEGRFGPCPFVFYVWNAMRFPDPARHMPQDWTKRNHGLVFQDYDQGTFVREWA